MISLANILFLMGLGFSLAAPLGPVNMEMIKRSLESRLGFLLGILTGLGAMTGDFLIASIVLFVGDEYLRNIIEIRIIYIILLIMNVGILSFIGISALKKEATEIPRVNNSSEISNNTNKSQSSSDSFLSGSNNDGLIDRSYVGRGLMQLGTGFVIVVSSPWSYFWWTSFGGYILNSGLPLSSGEERLIVTAFFLGGIFTWVLLFCLILGVSQRLASPKILNLITNVSALIILGFAVKILIDGMIYLL